MITFSRNITIYPPQKLLKYPHMMPRDVPIWNRFLASYYKDYSGFAYDVHVGSGMTIDETWPLEIKSMATALSQYRIDAVGVKESSIQIIEVKPRPPIGVIGQIIGYTALFQRDFNPSAPVTSLVVCETIDIDLKLLLNAQNIAWITV